MCNLIRTIKRLGLLSIIAFLAATIVACSDKKAGATKTEGEALTKVIILTDWYPQPEHGGFYQALAKGFYKDAGLDVEIRSGGGIRDIRPLVALGQVNFAVGTSDTTLIGMSRGLPLVALAPFFQHDPQCVMFHPEQNITTLQDLDNKVVMMQASLSHAEYLTKILKLNLKMIPLDFSISRIATDKSFVQQCFLTSEPIHLAAKGIKVDVIPLSDSGFDPYRHIYTSREFAESSPEVVRAFIKASIAGWVDFISADPTPAFEAIAEANPQQEPALMLLALEAIKKYKLVDGFEAQGDQTGSYAKSRLESQINALTELKLIDPNVDYMSSFSEKLLPNNYH